jgi:hypothetical protein
MGIEQMIYQDMMRSGEEVLIGNADRLKQFGIYLYSNNWLKRHNKPMRRKVK